MTVILLVQDRDKSDGTVSGDTITTMSPLVEITIKEKPGQVSHLIAMTQ